MTHSRVEAPDDDPGKSKSLQDGDGVEESVMGRPTKRGTNTQISPRENWVLGDDQGSPRASREASARADAGTDEEWQSFGAFGARASSIQEATAAAHAVALATAASIPEVRRQCHWFPVPPLISIFPLLAGRRASFCQSARANSPRVSGCHRSGGLVAALAAFASPRGKCERTTRRWLLAACERLHEEAIRCRAAADQAPRRCLAVIPSWRDTALLSMRTWHGRCRGGAA